MALKTERVEDFYLSAGVMDESSTLQFSGSLCYARPLYSQHHRQEFLSKWEIIALHAIPGNQQPPATPFFYRVKEIAGRRLSNLIEKSMRVMKHGLPQVFAFSHDFSKYCRFHFQAVPGNLHVNIGGRSAIPENNGNTYNSLIADCADLGCLPVFHDIDQ